MLFIYYISHFPTPVFAHPYAMLRMSKGVMGIEWEADPLICPFLIFLLLDNIYI